MNDGTGIYAIENIWVPRAYVGATKDSFANRWYAHCVYLRSRNHLNNSLRQDVRTLRADAFRFLVLQELPRSAKFAPFEQFWIDYLNGIGVRCYNVMLPMKQFIYDMEASEVPAEYCYTMTMSGRV